MSVHPLAGKEAPASALVNIDELLLQYERKTPDPEDPAQRVSFGTSGHRGTSLNGSFTESHILAITQAVCEYRKSKGIAGPLFLGADTHALSAPALCSALEVLAANGVEARYQTEGHPTPTPVISRSILRANAGKDLFGNDASLADGIIITPSHNPPADGGFKYNPPHGGPADTDVTAWIETRANELLAAKLNGVQRVSYEKALASSCIKGIDYIAPYVDELAKVLNMESIASAGLRLGADPLGGAALPYWEPIAEKYKLTITVTNPVLDPAFSFMPLDHDGKIRMDCSSPYAMAKLLHHASRYDLAFGNDPDADRHGIVTPKGLMNPNHYLSAAVWYLATERPDWPAAAGVGKTLVTSSMVDRVADSLSRQLYEVPVGFKWFVRPLLGGTAAFGGEESAGASFLQLDGSPWTTDKDGIIMCLLAAEMTAELGMDPAEAYDVLTKRFGDPVYERLDAPASKQQKAALSKLSADKVNAKTLAGSRITAVLTAAPGNNAPIGGLKVSTEDGWFAARPSGTEDIYKIYAESFLGKEHLVQLQDEARELVSSVLR
ncbi:phosphoglucomutase (alpha-D-glucose-1,6-bisphosphate-dependent) [Desulfovibrio sp. OttesenSCG-928-I05]|nr:phosphoglucomutase (alpha-D-glucose-1,6-bisphosphate-dependent) [Desulfovibrio sp. OttesenSCG-928-I05]